MKSWMIVAGLSVCLAGCIGETAPKVLPNSDLSLRRTSRELSNDASRRADEVNAPVGGEADARAEYNLMSENFEFVNLSDQDWERVDVWVNHRYVLHVPLMESNRLKRLDFDMFYDQQGHAFNTEDGKNPLQSLQIYHDGKMYEVASTMD